MRSEGEVGQVKSGHTLLARGFGSRFLTIPYVARVSTVQSLTMDRGSSPLVPQPDLSCHSCATAIGESPIICDIDCSSWGGGHG